MKKITILFIFIISLFFTQHTFAIGGDDVELGIDGLTNLEISTEWNPNGVQVINEYQDGYYFHITGKLLSYDGVSPIFLKLKDNTSGVITSLMELTGVSVPSNFSHPTCEVFGNLCIPAANQTIPKGIPGHSYSAIITTESGFVLSSKSLGSIPAVQGNVSDVVTGLVVTAKKQGTKQYYEIKGSVSVTKPNKFLSFNVVMDGSSNGGETIGEITYTKTTDVFTLPMSQTEIDAISSLDPGSYTLRIREVGNGGSLVQSYIIPDPIPTLSGSVGTGTGNIYTADQNARIKEGLVPDCGYSDKSTGKKFRKCDFNDFMTLITNVIEYIFILVLPIAAIVFAYAGYIYMTSGGDSGKRTAAKKAMTSLVIGIVVIMMAWLIVKTVLQTLGVGDGFKMFLDFK